MKHNNLFKLLISIIICQLAGIVGSIFTIKEIKDWYIYLNKPSFNPPNWIFGPVWTILYVLMGISLYLVWKNGFAVKNNIKTLGKKPWNRYSEKFWFGSWQKINIISIFCLQLLLNTLWSIIFFGMNQPGIAFFELLMLWVSILYMMINFYRVSKISSLLLIPYLLWVSFAGFLNLFIWILN